MSKSPAFQTLYQKWYKVILYPETIIKEDYFTWLVIVTAAVTVTIIRAGTGIMIASGFRRLFRYVLLLRLLLW